MLLPLLFSCLVKQQIQSLRRLTEYQMDLAEMEIFSWTEKPFGSTLTKKLYVTL